MARESNEIALSLSGGGVRALGYHLGTLHYLNRIDWLKNVSILSSVSGGSLVAIGYAVAAKKKMPFETFFQVTSKFVRELNTFEEIFENLAAKKPVAASGRRDLITCWAEVFRERYFKPYFDDPSFGIFWDGPKTHLQEVMFNAVELKSGIAFRFQHSDCNDQFKIGNGNVYLKHEFAKELKISDVMASSACIPGGMEPLQFPADYHWPNDRWGTKGPISRPRHDQVVDWLKKTFGNDGANIAIVDGGVYDNQTISSVLLALTRAHGKDSDHQHGRAGEEPESQEAKEPSADAESWSQWFQALILNYLKNANLDRLGLYIISDAYVKREPMYTPDPENCLPAKEKSWFLRLTLSRLNLLAWAIGAGLFMSAAVNLWDFLMAHTKHLREDGIVFLFRTDMSTVILNSLSTLIPGVLALAIVMAAMMARKKLDRAVLSALEKMPTMKRTLWSLVKNLTVGNIWDMVTVRGQSLMVMVNTFFMHRIRQLEYTLAYGNEALGKKILANEIYALCDKKRGISDELRQVVQKGASMGLQLWINKYGNDESVPAVLRGRDDLDVLLATGQATIIYNLMNRLQADHGELGTKLQEDLDRLKEDWASVNENPFCFLGSSAQR